MAYKLLLVMLVAVISSITVASLKQDVIVELIQPTPNFEDKNSFNDTDIIVQLKPSTTDTLMVTNISTISNSLDLLVVGGVEASKNEFPSIVNLIITDNAGASYLCGGNIIHPSWIFTAAHCLDGKVQPLSISVTAGDHYRSSNDGTEQRISGRRYVIKGDYNAARNLNDVALIELVSPFTINNFVKFIKVADPTYPAGGNTIAVVAGWGRQSNANASPPTNELRKANLSVVSNSACASSYSNIVGGAGLIQPSMLCATGNGRGACNGDSGGPLYCSTAGSQGQFVCGITSFGVANNCGNQNYPSVFMRVGSYVSWIRGYVNVETSGYTSNPGGGGGGGGNGGIVLRSAAPVLAMGVVFFRFL